jgi:hypothetical protein
MIPRAIALERFALRPAATLRKRRYAYHCGAIGAYTCAIQDESPCSMLSTTARKFQRAASSCWRAAS